MPSSDATNDDWTPFDGAVPQQERIELDDFDVLAEITHPLRGAVLRRLRKPKTVAELSSLMSAPVTRLYHHVNKLVDLGLVQVVATRQVGAVIERRYEVTARSFSIDPQLLERADSAEIAFALGSLFDVAKLDFQRSVEAEMRTQSFGDTRSTLSLGQVHLSDERHRELIERLDRVVAEFESDRDEDDADANHVVLFVAAFAEFD